MPVGHQAADPREEARPAIIPLHVLPCLEQRLLQEIQRLLFASGQKEGLPMQFRFENLEQVTKSIGLAILALPTSSEISSSEISHSLSGSFTSVSIKQIIRPAA
jgi:hypothetical protein